MADMELVATLDGAQLWQGPTYRHFCFDSADFRGWLVRSDLGPDVWLAADELAFDLLSIQGASLSRLHACLLEVDPWFDLPNSEDGQTLRADPATLITKWGTLGLTPAQAVAMDRADREPYEFEEWAFYAATSGWPMDRTVAWASLFGSPRSATRWINAGFIHSPDAAAHWAEHADELHPDTAWYLHCDGRDPVVIAQVIKTVNKYLVATLPAPLNSPYSSPVEMFGVREDAVVLLESVPGLSTEQAVLCAKAGLREPDEVWALLRRKDLDWAVIEGMAALRPLE